jgi:hypothetical protein
MSTFIENLKYEIQSIDHYLDGGSIGIKTVDGTLFFVDHRLDTKTEGSIYLNYPESSKSRPAYGFEKDKLIEALVEYSLKQKEN